MPFRVTHIVKIYNHSKETALVVNMQSGKGREIPAGKTVDLGMPVPWMVLDWDASGSNPHLIEITLQHSGRKAYIWQKDETIFASPIPVNGAPVRPDPDVDGDKDLVLRDSDFQIHRAGKTHYKVGPAMSAATGESAPDNGQAYGDATG
ncbi:hypothetical protein [Celeribacter sp.]|uniref:hypothetical protein n=1 Tax=Celeribacter sp. TaxID=1890673 RepID=UPI003A95579F